MKIKVNFHNVLYEIDPEHCQNNIGVILNINDNTTITELIEQAGEPFADFSHYYDLTREYCCNQVFFPYIINSLGEVKWDVPYYDTKVIEFIFTHKIEENTIESKIGYIQAGGPGIKDLEEVWRAVYLIIEQFTTIIGAVGITVKGYQWIRSLFKSPGVPPHTYFDLIYSRILWNHNELASLLDIEKEDAKQLLKIFGYKYDKSKMMFVQQPVSHKLREKLAKINLLDIC